MSIIDFKKLGAVAAAAGADQTKAKEGGGGDYQPPVVGPTRLRFVGYIELGKQEGTFQGAPTVKNKVTLLFELSGPKHPPKDVDGTKYPHIVKVEETLSLSPKANFFKLFQTMNYAGKAQHMIQLLGESFKGEIVHREIKGRDGRNIVFANLKRGSIAPPRYEAVDPETGEPTGEYKVLPVAPAISPLRAFLWDHADKAQWDSLFIDGEYPAETNDAGEVVRPARSKNVWQETIRDAVNFDGSPVQALLIGGQDLDLPSAEYDEDAQEETQAPAAPARGAQARPAAKQAAKAADEDDLLNGVV